MAALPVRLSYSRGMGHFLWREVFIIVSGAYPRFDNTDTISALAELTNGSARKLSLVTVVEPESPPLDQAAREAIKQSLKRFEPHVQCAITQVCGSGLAVGIALSIASGMMMITHRVGVAPYPSALTRTSAETATRLRQYGGELATVAIAEIVNSIEHTRADQRREDERRATTLAL